MINFFLLLFCVDVSLQEYEFDRGSDSNQIATNPCAGKMTCQECITSDPQCAWCITPGLRNNHCDYWSKINISCSEYSVFPNNSFDIKRDEKLSEKGSAENEIVQIKPQELYIKIRPNVPFLLKIDYRQAEDYPVDLYYLMDLSNSMRDDKENLALLGDELATKMKTITKKFQLGFGSFVEKVALPFVNTHPDKKDEPCTGCAAPYGFRNHMSLNTDTDKFSQEVKKSKTSGNYDAPEGGFDAVVQAVSCQTDIGWRNNSRKLLLFSTDAGYHFAGDGKLAGIVKPNDGACHLNNKGLYTESTEQDYPSISQLNSLIQNYKVNVIFAVTDDQKTVYNDLSMELEGSSVGTLAGDSSNIVELIEQQYDKITSEIRLTDNASDPIKITYYSECLSKQKQNTNICKGIGVGGSVSFDAEIQITSCPKDRSKWNQTIQIYPASLNEAVTIHLEMICECDCEKPWNEERASKKCSNGNGTYECGVCSCNENRYGNKCECDAKGSINSEDETACYKGNDTVPCSGKGKCYCGQCECFPRENPEEKTTGQFCDCDNFSCNRANKMICGGPKQGICECGVCKCLPDWKGPSCNCRNTNDTCISPGEKKICSDHGVCRCGECTCKDTEEERYDGEFCQKCLICPGSCEAYKTCAQCKIFKTGSLTEEQCDNCTGNYFEIIDVDNKEGSQECTAIDDSDNCRFFFFYKLDRNNKPIVQVKKQKECQKSVNALAVGLGVTGGIVALGLAILLAWKLITMVHDAREYARFEKARAAEKWNNLNNPLYKQAVSTFQNPSFGDQ